MTLSIESVKTMNHKEFGGYEPKLSGVKFQYTFDNGLMTSINFDAHGSNRVNVKLT